ncbi:MAG TPA: TonB-dependent receptor [Terriglobales bacterium]|nr:TonB-dependent receptor [Terriglobales bacterium]
MSAALVHAQDASTGALRGTVKDSTQAPVPNATVGIANTATGITYAATTDAEGRYFLDLLPPGDYSARAEFQGMSPEVTPNLHIDVGGLLQLDFSLSVAGAKETVTVSAGPQLVETQPTAINALLDERAISDLPLNGRRYTDLALLAPGVSQDPRGLTSASNGDLAFGGIRGYQSSYLVDGADNNNAFFAQARGRYRAPYQFSNEVVQEFRVSSNTYGAELGRAGGAVVNVVTKSGTNHYHGTGFYFFRDSSLNAVHAFTQGTDPEDRQQQFGFTFGGPIKQNKAFFFLGLDQHIFHVPALVRFLDGSTKLIPQKGDEPLHHGDYEDTDKALVFAAADQLSTMTGNFHSAQFGNTGFAKVDVSLSPKHYLTARLNTSRYYGSNNVFFDPSSPITTYMMSDNGEEQVNTASGSLSLTSSLTPRTVSHLRAQLSRDLQQSFANTDQTLTRISSVTDGFGRSTILPRNTNEHRFHLTETLSREGARHSLKFGGDGLFTRIVNYFPSLSGGEYIFDDIKVDPWTFEPMIGGMETTPLRAYAHAVPRYYIQNFGSYTTHPNTNEYAAFAQDTIRVTDRLALSLGVRYDLQTFATAGLVSNPLWPASGKVPFDTNNVSPRVGLAYSIGNTRPLVIRAGYGLFYTRIPQIYTSTVQSDNGLAATNLILDNTDYYHHQIFPQYPNPLVNCPRNATGCSAPASLGSFLNTEVAAFAPNFQTPKVEQASLGIEREVARRLYVGISYMYVHGENLIRARDVNLPQPTDVTYPVYDDSGTNLLGYYNVPSFSTWQMTRSFTCPYPPCINPLARPIPQLGAIDQYDGAASSVYHGMTVSVNRRMTDGLYFRLAYTYAHAIDDGQDALVAGRPVTVQNSYSASAERASSVTDQRQRFAASLIAEPRPFHREHPFLGKIFNDWKISSVVTIGSGRPVDAKVFGDPNQDGNDSNDRLPGQGRNAYLGPDYATTDMRLTRHLFTHDRMKLDFVIESFNVFNRDNLRVNITDDSFQNTAGKFVYMDQRIGVNYYPAQYRIPANFMKATDAYAPRQIQLALKFSF